MPARNGIIYSYNNGLAEGGVNPAGIIGPAIVATAVSTGVAVIYCKVKDRRRRV